MRALLLAAGFGTRLRPITDHVPKCLVEVHGKPLLDYWFELLFEAGVERALVNTHYLSQVVEAHVAKSRWRDQIDLVHEDVLLGTGGTVLANRAWAGDAPLLVAHADNLTDFDMRVFETAHRARPDGCLVTMLAFQTDDPKSCGILELDGQNRVQVFHEKVESPPGDLANAAVYIIEPEVIDLIASLGKPVVDLSTEILPKLLGRIFAVEIARYHRDIGTPQSLATAQVEFRPRRD